MRSGRLGLVLTHVLTFLWRQKAWALLGPFLMLLGTVLHEGAHALAVIALGGTVDSMVLTPRFSREGVTFGQTWHEGVPEARLWVVACAPFVFAHVHALAGCFVVARTGARWARVVFFTSVLLPLFDIALLLAGVARQADRSDLGRFAEHRALFALWCLPAVTGLGVLAFRAFRRHWGPPEGLTAPQFGVLLAAFLGSTFLKFF